MSMEPNLTGTLQERREFWARNELRTDPADTVEVQDAIDAAWGAAGLKPPKAKICASPSEAWRRLMWRHYAPIIGLSGLCAVGAGGVLFLLYLPILASLEGYEFALLLSSFILVGFGSFLLVGTKYQDTMSFWLIGMFFAYCVSIVLLFLLWILGFSGPSDRAGKSALLIAFLNVAMIWPLVALGINNWLNRQLDRVGAPKEKAYALIRNAVTMRTVSEPDDLREGGVFRQAIGTGFDLNNAIAGVANEGVIRLLRACGEVHVTIRGDALAIDRPRIIRTDGEGQLHNATGPAVKWEDGDEQYFIHGYLVEQGFISDPENHVWRALAIQNAERRRVLCEHIGWDRILEKVGGRVIDEDDDERIGALVEVGERVRRSGSSDPWPFDRRRFVRCRCGKGRWFALPVPDELENVRDAQAWIAKVNPWQWSAQEIRT